jgi:hypothetical protein
MSVLWKYDRLSFSNGLFYLVSVDHSIKDKGKLLASWCSPLNSLLSFDILLNVS